MTTVEIAWEQIMVMHIDVPSHLEHTNNQEKLAALVKQIYQKAIWLTNPTDQPSFIGSPTVFQMLTEKINLLRQLLMAQQTSICGSEDKLLQGVEVLQLSHEIDVILTIHILRAYSDAALSDEVSTKLHHREIGLKSGKTRKDKPSAVKTFCQTEADTLRVKGVKEKDLVSSIVNKLQLDPRFETAVPDRKTIRTWIAKT